MSPKARRRLFFACPVCGARDSVAVDAPEMPHAEAEVETLCESGHRIRFAVRPEGIVYLGNRPEAASPPTFRAR